jgi:hypothetical protein
VLLFCNNSSTNFVLDAEVYLVRFTHILFNSVNALRYQILPSNKLKISTDMLRFSVSIFSGVIQSKGIFFQVFSPEEITKSYVNVVGKLNTDFKGLSERWSHETFL